MKPDHSADDAEYDPHRSLSHGVPYAIEREHSIDIRPHLFELSSNYG